MVRIATETEKEITFEGLDGEPVPELDDVPGVARVVRAPAEDLDAVYYDTAGLALLAGGVTLRHRTGGHDAGWHLKTPARGGRTETRVPYGNESHAGYGKPPPELTRQVVARTRGRELTPVAHLRTHRERRLLLDTAGRRLAEVAFDMVSAQVLGTERFGPDGDGDSAPGGTSAHLTTWSEVEVELEDGEESLLTAVAARLSAAGLRTAAEPGKLRHALSVAELAPPRAARAARGSAGEVVLARLREQAAVLMETDPAVRADEPDSVHRMRVAARRIRDALRTFRPLFRAGATRELEAELRWLGEVLGDARDHEVLARRLREHAARLADSTRTAALTGTMAGQIAAMEATAYRRAWRQAYEKLGGRRYFALLDAIDAWLAAPPLAPKAAKTGKAAARQLAACARRDHRKLADRTAKALAMGPGAERDRALHSARKAAKRLRYAAETARPAVGKPARRLAERATSVQHLLGSHQDSVIARQALPDLSDHARSDGHDTFAYGLLYADEQRRADRAVRALPGTWAKAADRRLTRWR